MAHVAIRDLVVEYSSGGYAARLFDHYDLELTSGELVVLLGASGCGKSTLLSILGSLLQPTSGSVTVDGREIRGSRARTWCSTGATRSASCSRASISSRA